MMNRIRRMLGMRPAGEGYDCPATGFTTRCNKGRNGACPEWIHIQGKHPNTGADVDLFDCARKWQPVMLLEVAHRQNQSGAAVESLRNELVKAGQRLGNDMKIAAAIARAPEASQLTGPNLTADQKEFSHG